MLNQLRTMAREPLVQFLLIGAVIFAGSRILETETDDPRTIRVDAKVQEELATLFEKTRERLPTRDEMNQLVQRYVDSEALVREANALQLGEGDEMIRERLVQRMSLLMYSGIEVAPPDDDVLKAWLDAQPDRYATPATISFRIIGVDGTEEEAQAAALRAAEIEADGGRITGLDLPIVTFANRSRQQMAELFNADFVSAIAGQELGAWTTVESPQGWQAVQLNGTKPKYRPTFDEISKRAAGDWQQEQLQREARAALEALKRSYTVVAEPLEPDLISDGPLAEAAQ